MGLLMVELYIPESHSLKTKRMVIKSIKDRLCRRFNVAVAETGYTELWQRAELSVVSVSSARRILESEFEAINRELENNFGSELVGTSMELIG